MHLSKRVILIARGRGTIITRVLPDFVKAAHPVVPAHHHASKKYAGTAASTGRHAARILEKFQS